MESKNVKVTCSSIKIDVEKCIDSSIEELQNELRNIVVDEKELDSLKKKQNDLRVEIAQLKAIKENIQIVCELIQAPASIDAICAERNAVFTVNEERLAKTKWNGLVPEDNFWQSLSRYQINIDELLEELVNELSGFDQTRIRLLHEGWTFTTAW